MKRLWYLGIQRRGDRFEARLFNVFDTNKPEDPIEIELPDLAAVESLIRALEPVSQVARTYMDVTGQGAFLRISSLPVEPLEDLLLRAVEELRTPRGSIGLATMFLTRSEIVQRLARLPDANPEAGE